MLKNADISNPPLGISKVVHGRHRPDGRVRYLVDPKGRDAEEATPERVVLKRWRRRSVPGYVFGGARLSPTVWRAVGLVFGTDARSIVALAESEVESQIVKSQGLLRRRKLSLPNPKVVYRIFQCLGIQRLTKILNRHLIDDGGKTSGTPDLFLYQLKIETRRATFFIFVEVKKSDEPLKPHQRAEIEFLRQIGVPAREFRFSESRRSVNQPRPRVSK